MKWFMLAAVALACIGIIASTREALASCNPNRIDDNNYWYVGASRHGAGQVVGGMESTPIMYTPFVYPGSTNENSVFQYVTLVNIYGSDVRWYQAGRVQRQQFKYHYFEWTNFAGTVYQFYDSVPVPADGTSERWDVLYGNCGANCYSFQIIGQVRHTITGLGWTPAWGEFWGETQSLASQMPGGYNNAATWYFTKIWIGAGPWTDFDGFVFWNPPGSAPNYFGGIKWSARTYTIWDKYCQV